MAWIALGLAALLNALGAAGIRRGLARLGPMPIGPRALLGYIRRLLADPVAVGGGVLFALAPVGTAAALTVLPVGVAYPLLVAANLLLVVAAGVGLLGERLGARGLLGITLVLLGGVLVSVPT